MLTTKKNNKMKKLLSVLCLLFAISYNVMSQQETDSDNGPQISFEKISHDFGKIPYNGNGTYEFRFKNIGNEPLILSQPKSSCGCTVPEWPKKPILPGETDVIRVTYKNTNRPGNFNKYVTIFSNSKKDADIKLYIRGTVLQAPTQALPTMDNAVTASPVNNSGN